jgi:hypothetical protein
MSDSASNVEKLIEKAATAEDAVKAMNFAQAACNAANAMKALRDAKQ